MLSSLLTGALPDRAALAYEGVELSFAEVADGADKLAASLGVTAGEPVALVAGNVPALAMGLLAAWRVGAAAVPLSSRLRRFELARAFADAEPAAVLSVSRQGGTGAVEDLQAVADEAATVRRRVLVDQLGGLIEAVDVPGSRPGTAGATDAAALLYTSGTTGEPKGALLTHGIAEATGANMAELLGSDAQAPYCLVIPASHAFGLGCLLCGLMAGATAVLSEAATSLQPLLEAMKRHRADVLHGSPALFSRLLGANPDVPIRAGFTAGSQCPPGILETLDERGARILNIFGMTEIGAACSCRRDDPPDVRYRTVGRALPGYELRLSDSEIQVRSDYLPSGYHRRPWGEDELTADGWFRTGDLGTIDDRGNVVISGRAKEVVHVGGFNVFPAEVESFLLTHPAIQQAAVVGIPHPSLGETVAAFIVPAADHEALQARDVVAYARAGIAGYKVPYTVRIVEELPQLASGKPDRRALAAQLAPEESLHR